MISNAAGQMKNHGFETQKIIDMKNDCEQLIQILDQIKLEVLKFPEHVDVATKNLNSVGQDFFDEI